MRVAATRRSVIGAKTFDLAGRCGRGQYFSTASSDLNAARACSLSQIPDARPCALKRWGWPSVAGLGFVRPAAYTAIVIKLRLARRASPTFLDALSGFRSDRHDFVTRTEEQRTLGKGRSRETGFLQLVCRNDGKRIGRRNHKHVAEFAG